VSYLAGASISQTPPSCIPKFPKADQKNEEDGSLVGESGGFIECQVWGGSMQMDFPYSSSDIKTVSLPSIILIFPGTSRLFNILFFFC
jgi:hypothetical protein